jgi:DNA-binding response OmpR family regulator
MTTNLRGGDSRSGATFMPALNGERRAWGRILIAEDEDVVRRLIVEWLREEGYQCECVGTAQEAVAALATDAYDLLVTDIRLPDNETLEWLQACRSGAPAVPVIVITGYPSVGTAVEAVRHAVVDYLVKPVNAESLCRSVGLAIGKGRVLRALRKAREEMRLWGQAMDGLEESLAAGAKGVEPTEHVLDQTMILFRQIATSLKATIEATKSGRSDYRKMNLCAVVGCMKPAVYEDTLRRSMEVLANTKNAFKSKELGNLRKLLAGILKEECQP